MAKGQMNKAPIEPTRIPFIMAPKADGPTKVVRIGKELIGTLVWQYANGDGLIKTETAFWYIPANCFKAA